MASVVEQVLDWARGIAYWEQCALDLASRDVDPSDLQLNNLVQLLLEDEGLAERVAERKPLALPSAASTADSESTLPKLVALSQLKNVNALAENQRLEFGPALTAVYGGNGSGKSGYARVLGCAGFTRGDRHVLPDVNKASRGATKLSARIEIKQGETPRSIEYCVGESCADLSGFYVFDSTSVHVHLSESNPLSFTPVGLACLTKMADISDMVRARLHQKANEAMLPNSFACLFVGQSEVSEIIGSLGPATDLGRLRQLAALSDVERARIPELDLGIARLKARKVTEELRSIEQAASDLKRLSERLSLASASMSDEVAVSLQSRLLLIESQRRAAAQLSLETFKAPSLTQIGSEAWYGFSRAAKELAGTEGSPEDPYPRADSVCLLCQQPLTEGARALLQRLWQHLGGEIQAQLRKTEASYTEGISQVASVPLDFLDDDNVAYRLLESEDVTLLEDARTYLRVAGERRSAIMGWKSGIAHSAIPLLPKNPSVRVDLVVSRLEEEAESLRRQDTAAAVQELSAEKLTLDHRALLAERLDEVEKHVKSLQWAQRALRVGGTTAHITKQYNKMFTTLVTDKYLELFQSTLASLGRPLRVGVATRGHKGKVVRQIEIQVDPAGNPSIAHPEKILSEGEKRAVALADFLTEVRVDTTSSGIILDDPVTSLELEWREKVATILAEEARSRQVVVFTHDLPFLHFLKENAGKLGVDIDTHWIKRGDDDGKPGHVFLNNGPALEADYKSTSGCERTYANALRASAEEQERLLQEGFATLRACYEAFVIFNLFGGVVRRFEERVRFDLLREVEFDRVIRDQLLEGYDRLSRHIGAHLHSDVGGSGKPTPATLLAEIDAFKAMKKKLKEMKSST